MKLLVDIGNSRIKWCLYHEDGTLGEPKALPHAKQVLVTGLDNAWKGLPKVESVYMVSVASPEVEAAVQAWVESNWGLSLRKLYTQSTCAGVVNGYRKQSQLGVDRWAAIIGGYQRSKKAVCIVDSGTALTCDVVNEAGIHLGGWIVPGRELQRVSLLQGTAGIDIDNTDAQAGVWGRDTVTCIETGLVQAQVALVNRCMERMQRKVNGAVALVITGGDADVLLPHIEYEYQLVPNLVFQGMTYMLVEQG